MYSKLYDVLYNIPYRERVDLILLTVSIFVNVFNNIQVLIRVGVLLRNGIQYSIDIRVNIQFLLML